MRFIPQIRQRRSSVSTAKVTTAANLARTTRLRRGSRENVTSPVRCPHSWVMAVIAITGSSSEIGIGRISIQSSKEIIKSLNTATSSAITITATNAVTVMPNSQRPALVSVILRSSVDTKRANGTRGVSEMSIVGDETVALMPELLGC